MSKCVLVIDGENFLHKVEEVLKREGIDKTKVDLASIDSTLIPEQERLLSLLQKNNVYEGWAQLVCAG